MERYRWRRYWIRRSSARSAQAATTVPAREHAHIGSRRERSQTRAWSRALRPDAVPFSQTRIAGGRRRSPNLYRIVYSCRTPLHHTHTVPRRLQSSTAIQPSTVYSYSALYSIQPLHHPSAAEAPSRPCTDQKRKLKRAGGGDHGGHPTLARDATREARAALAGVTQYWTKTLVASRAALQVDGTSRALCFIPSASTMRADHSRGCHELGACR
jgi:hypothetical protein